MTIWHSVDSDKSNLVTRHVISNPEQLQELEGKSLVGLGVGLLSATAVSLSSTFSDLPLAGADTVRVAFRIGVLVFGVSESIETRDTSQQPDPWAYVVHHVDATDAQNELDNFNSKTKVPTTGKIFISAASQTSVAVSGPPAKLKVLFNKCQFYRNARFVALPVYGGLCHAPHIYQAEHIQHIVHSHELNLVKKAPWPLIPVYSTSTGSTYAVRNAAELFESVVTELLTKPIFWDKVVHGIQERTAYIGSHEALLYSFGSSGLLNELNTSLNSGLHNLNIGVKNLMAWVSQVSPDDGAPRGTAQSKLAIIGMSCRLPGGATSNEKFWDILEKGLDVSRQIPADRFDIGTHYDPTGKQLNKSMTQYGCFIDEPGMFDAPFFNMSPRESQVVDPQMRLALVTAYEALEQAGFVANRTPSTRLERIGTYYGQAADDYREVNQGQEVSTYYIPGGCRAFGPGRINYFFKFAGPSYSIDTACSSGLAAIEVCVYSVSGIRREINILNDKLGCLSSLVERRC